MHNTLQLINHTVRVGEKNNPTPEKQTAYNACKDIAQSYQNKLNNGLALTADDEKVLEALLIIVVYMVKDSSITLNVEKVM